MIMSESMFLTCVKACSLCLLRAPVMIAEKHKLFLLFFTMSEAFLHKPWGVHGWGHEGQQLDCQVRAL